MFVIGTVGLLASLFVQGVLYALVTSSSNNYAMLENAFFVCKPIAYHPGEKSVVLRLDDVQAYAWRDITERIITDSTERGFPVVAGVIPKNFRGDDAISTFLEKRECNVEIALHGWDHGASATDDGTTVGEFELLTEAQAQQRIEWGLKALQPLAKHKIVTFIPPQNQISDGSKEAMAKDGLTMLSGEGSDTYDYAAAFWNYTQDRFVNAVEVESLCEAHLANNNECVVMIHPQDFVNEDNSIDETRYNEYLKFLNYLTAHHLQAATFRELAAPSIAS